MKKTVKELIEEVIKGFSGEIIPSYKHLLCEYNAIVKSLYRMLPIKTASIVVSAKDGTLYCNIDASLITRIFFENTELLRASKELLTLLPEAKLYHASEDGIFVTVCGECTVYYCDVPCCDDEDSASLVLAPSGLLYKALYAYLLRSAYLYVGDYDSANAYTEEYNSLLEDIKRENGVAE